MKLKLRTLCSRGGEKKILVQIAFGILAYRVIRIVLNGVLDLSVRSVINVNSSVVPRKAWENGGPNRSQLKEKKSKENILWLFFFLFCFWKHSQPTVSQFAPWSCQDSTIPSPSISSYSARFLVLSGSRAPLRWRRLACSSKLYSPSETGTWWTRLRRKKAFARAWSAAWLLRPSQKWTEEVKWEVISQSCAGKLKGSTWDTGY